VADPRAGAAKRNETGQLATGSETATMAKAGRIDRIGDTAPHPELGHVGWVHLKQATQAGLTAHRHDDAWEICWVARGSVSWWIEEQRYEVPTHHLFITQPNEWHGAVHQALEASEIMWINLRPTQPSVQALVHPLITAPRVIAADRRLTARWRDLIDLHQPPYDDFSVTAIDGALRILLAEITRAASRSQQVAPAALATPSTAVSANIAKAMAFVRAHLDHHPEVHALARIAGLGPSQFHARFVAEVGESPAEWTRRVHLDEAKRRLNDTNHPITDIAIDLGFPSSQYFATVFKRYVGVSPREFRRSERG
jgi:AraC-like DNA-binding protein